MSAAPAPGRRTLRPPVAAVVLAAAVAARAAGPPAAATAPDRSALIALALARIAVLDPAGLGSEARELMRWAGTRGPLELGRSGPTWTLRGAEGAAHAVSPALGLGVSRLADYSALSLATGQRPVQSRELAVALTHEQGVLAVRDTFERSMERALILDGEPVLAELGGEALIRDERLVLVEHVDPSRDVLRAVARDRADPEALGELLKRQPEAMALLDPVGQLEREVTLWRERADRGVPEKARRRVLDMAVDTVLRNASDAFVLHPRSQLEAIVATDWSGRLIGAWHVHPPSWRTGGWGAGGSPSRDDVEVAASTGRFVTIAFRPDGFDAWDLRRGTAGVPPPLVEHRSPEWRRHFRSLHARLARSLAPQHGR